MESGYQQVPVGDGRVRFAVTAAPIRSRGYQSVVATAAVALGAITTSPPHPAGGTVLIRIAITAAVWGAARALERWSTRRLDRRRSPGGSFVVSPANIEVRGAVIDRVRLRSLVVSDVARVAGPPTVVRAGEWYDGTPLPRSRPADSRRAGDAVASFVLCAESDGGLTTLAGGMTEVTAHGLLSDVSRILSLG